MSAIIDKLYSSTNGETYSFRQLFEVVNEKNKACAYKNVLSASQELGMIERSDINIDIKFEQESISGYRIGGTMDQITLRVPVAVKAKVTQALKDRRP